MSEEFKDFTVTPTLTFEPLKEEAQVAQVKKEILQSLRWMTVFFTGREKNGR